jgi:hypothetical protein
MIVRGNLFVLVPLIFIFAWFGCARNPCNTGFNPDVTCHVLDSRSDGTTLVEYFNADTNELRLVLIQNGVEKPIQHPFGHVWNFNEKLNENTISFDQNDPKSLLVNGEKFTIKEL